MIVDILHDFLLFNFSDVERVMKLLTDTSWKFLACLFIAELLIARFREKSNTQKIVKRFLIIQFIIAFLPLFFHPIAKSGFAVGDEILSLKRSGIVANWSKVKRDLQKETKKAPSLGTTFFHFITFDDMDLVRKGAALVITVIFLLIKVIYSAIYYGSYLLISGRALLAVFTQYSSNLGGILSTIIYLILVPIVVAIVLYFLNDVLDFDPNKMGFVESLGGIASFIVLGLCLFASFKIAKGLIDGQGPEGWGAQMGGLLSAGLGYKMLSFGGDMMKMGVSSVASGGAALGARSLGSFASPIASGMGHVATSPFKAAFSGVKSGLTNNFKSRIQRGEGRISDLSPIDYGKNSVDINTPITKGRYQSEFSKIAGSNENISVGSALNPVNHIKAAGASTKSAYHSTIAKGKHGLGLPQYTRHLNTSEKLSYVGNKLLGGKNQNISQFSAQKLSNEKQIQNSVIANRISSVLDSKGDKK